MAEPEKCQEEPEAMGKSGGACRKERRGDQVKKRVRDERALLTDFYRNTMKIADEDLLQLCVQASHVEKLKAGQVLFEQGAVPTQVCFMWDGVARGFLTSDAGKEITDCISFRRGESVMPESQLDLPASITVEMLVKSEIICMPMEAVCTLLACYPSLYTVYGEYLLRSAELHRELKMAICQYAAQQRYEWFLQAYPGLIDRIPHKYIASLLNMTTVTLSNVRRAMKEREQTSVHTAYGSPVGVGTP